MHGNNNSFNLTYFRSPEKKNSSAKPESFKYVVQCTDKSSSNTVSFKMIR